MLERLKNTISGKFSGAVSLLKPFIVILLLFSLLWSTRLIKDIQFPAQPELEKLPDYETIEEATVSTEAQAFKVSITGQVKSPGVYEFKKGSIVQDLLNSAGGVLDKSADLLYLSQSINLARELAPNEQIYIPHRDEKLLLVGSKPPTGSPTSSPGANTSINLNTASASELQTLPGVGPATAEKIIAGRPYAKIEDIKNVPGIGDVTFVKLKDLIVV